jgi:hypothetical protein
MRLNRTSIIFLMIFLSHATVVCAQKATNLEFKASYAATSVYGSMIDVTLNNQYGIQKARAVAKSSFEVGAQVQQQVYKWIYLQSGLGLIQKGGAVEHSTAMYPIDVTLTYLYLPAYFVIKPAIGKKLSGSLQSGLDLNFELASKQDFTKGVKPGYESNKFIPAFSVGASITYQLNEHLSLIAGYRHINDLKNFYKNSEVGSFLGDTYVIEYTMKTKGNIASVGVVYSLKKSATLK